MAKKGNTGESSKKASGQARKAEAAESKKAEQGRAAASVEDAEWSKGSKDNSKKEAASAKAAEAARKKGEKDALLAAEEASLPKAKSAASKSGKKTPARTGTLNLDDLDAPDPSSPGSLNATGIDNALDALTLTTAAGNASDIDRHPERRYKAAYAAYEEKRLEEMKDEKGLRRNQKLAEIRKEFEKHPENPFNQVAGKFNSTREELREIGAGERREIEERLGGGE